MFISEKYSLTHRGGKETGENEENSSLTSPFSLPSSLHSSITMLSEIIKFEWAYRKGRPATWIYFAILFIVPIILVSTDAIKITGGGEQTKENAPSVIAFLEVAFTYLFMMIT